MYRGDTGGPSEPAPQLVVRSEANQVVGEPTHVARREQQAVVF